MWNSDLEHNKYDIKTTIINGVDQIGTYCASW